MIFGDLVGLKLPHICLTGEENPRKNITQETCPDRGSNPGPLRDRRSCYRLLHSGGLYRYYIQGGRAISAIIVTDDYLCYKKQKVLTTFFLILIFTELFKFKTSDERQH